MFIIKFAEPIFACFFGALLLREDIFKLQYLAAFILISAGIVLGNKTQRKA
jgi:drug/metabolite transporter (DMT)-like permease